MSHAPWRRSLVVDGAAIAIVSVAICLFAHELVFMTALVPVVVLLRMVAFARWVRPPWGMGRELAALAACTLLGAFNDWSSVDRHMIYDYGVPHFTELSSIPIWMLIFWGVVIRFMGSLAGLSPPRRQGVAARLAVGLLLVVITRQAIYRLYLDPILSWLPFALALGCYLLLFRAGVREARLVAIAMLGGTAVEVLYINVGGLHSYHLGLVGGVPLWIMLWWPLALLVLGDLVYVARKRASRAPHRVANSARPLDLTLP